MLTVDRKTGELIELPAARPVGCIRADDAADRLGMTLVEFYTAKSVLRLTPAWIDSDGWTWLHAAQLGVIRQILAAAGDCEPPLGFLPIAPSE